MSQNLPFSFGGGQPRAPIQQTHQQQQIDSNTNTPANLVPATPMATAQPIAPGGIDFSALLNAGLTPEQMGVVLQMLSGGAAIPPPPPPSLAVQNAPPVPAIVPAANQHHDPPPPAQKQRAASGKAEDIDMDKEEGEVEEGELDDAPKARDFLRTPPKGPRNHSRSPLLHAADVTASRRASYQAGSSRPAVPSRAQSSTNAIPQIRKASAPSANGHLVPQRLPKDAAAKAFILEMHKAGYSYEHIAKEVGDSPSLRRMYQQLNLPVISTRSPANGTPPSQPPRKPPVVKAPAPQDRTAYLAKLQAAKKKKSEPTGTTPATTPTAAAENQNQPKVVPVNVPVSDARPVPPTQPTPRKPGLSKDKTELIRQRMEALKAQRAATSQTKPFGELAPVSGPAVVTNGHMDSQRPLHNGVNEAVARAPDDAVARVYGTSSSQSPVVSTPVQPIATPTQPPQPPFPAPSPTLNRGFGLPGLFTLGAPPAIGQHEQAGNSSHLAPTANAQAATATVGDDGSVASGRPFGQFKDTHASDRCVIEVSSDEDDDDEMDLDKSTDNGATAAGAAKDTLSRAQSTLRQHPLHLNLPKPNGFSAPGTPAVGTPGADLKRKLDEIEETKRAIAEAEKKRRKSGKPKDQAQLPADPAPVTSSSVSASEAATPADIVPLHSSPFGGGVPLHDRPSSTTSASARQQEKDQLRRRLAELEAQKSKLNESSFPATSTGQQPLSSAEAPQESSSPVERSKQPGPESAKLNTNVVEESDAIDDDDEDLYGENSPPENVARHAERLVAPQQTAVNSQATMVSYPSQNQLPEAQADVNPFHDDDIEDLYEERAATPQSSLATHVSEITRLSDPRAAEDTNAAEADSADDDDDDDLDHVYAPPTLAQPTSEPPAETTSSNVGIANVEEPDDSDDAMDMSDASSSDDSDEPDEVEPVLQMKGATRLAVEATPQGERGYETDGTNQSQEVARQELERAIDDDLAPELQPPTEELSVPTQQASNTLTHFTPYESPLRRFKDYRYHPDFESTVPGGFKSLTYSHKIDPIQTLCPFETAGGLCKDKSCTHQHFKKMALTDNELLRIIGTQHTPGRTPEEKQRWTEGLTALVKELRSNQVKDVSAIAQRIAEYRRTFVSDPSKVLMLDE